MSGYTSAPAADWRSVAEEFEFLAHTGQDRPLRTVREFAEQEVVMHNGRWAGQRFRVDRQPVVGPLLEQMDDPRWTDLVITGPSQSGKTVVGFIIPILYHLFERQENVICGVPDLNMLRDKWDWALRPAILASRYRDLLPRSGGGSRGGTASTAVNFGNGTWLRFMTAGGDDKNRSGETARVLVVTEAEIFGESSAQSDEADKLKQLRARQRSWPAAQRRTYIECTVTTAQGLTWRSYRAGTETRVALRCPHCKGWSAPSLTPDDRKMLSGWEQAEDVREAQLRARFHCPLCGRAWSEAQRAAMHKKIRLVHRGQTITSDGTVLGEPAVTDAFGYRWSTVNNLMLSAADVARDHYLARQDPNEDNALRELDQFVWALPHEPAVSDLTPLSVDELKRRTRPTIGRGVLPAESVCVTMGVDLGKYRAHWVLIAWRADGGGHVADYGVFGLSTDHLGVERATLAGLRELREMVEAGWAWQEGPKPNRSVDQVWIDSNFFESTAAVYAFVRECRAKYGADHFRATLGRSIMQARGSGYSRPRSVSGAVQAIGDGYHMIWRNQEQVQVVEVNADQWKSWFHARLHTPKDQPGGITLFDSLDRNEHVDIAKHWTAEKQVQDFVAGKGLVLRWERIRRENHWLDCCYLACAAASACGVSVTPAVEKAQRRGRIVVRDLEGPDGMPLLPQRQEEP